MCAPMKFGPKIHCMKTFSTLLLCAVLGAVAFAKDKKDETPKPIVDAKVQADIFKSQRDYANLARQAMPVEIELARREQDLKDQLAKASESCGDVTKWKLNSVSLECEAVPPAPPAPEVAKPEAPKP